MDLTGRIVIGKSPRRVPIDEIVIRNARMLLIGSPGSGKSILLSFLASGCAVGNHGLSWPDRALPFVTIVRELKDAELSSQWFAAQLEAPPDGLGCSIARAGGPIGGWSRRSS
jgi:hypothetical protein